MAKIEIFPLCIGYSCTTLWVKNSREIALSRTFFWRYSHYFIFAKFIYLFGVLRRFQHCTGHITKGSWKGRGNQYIQFIRGFCTVNCRPTASNYQLSHLRLCRESNPGLRGGRRECYHSATMAPFIFAKIQDGRKKWQKLKFFPLA